MKEQTTPRLLVCVAALSALCCLAQPTTVEGDGLQSATPRISRNDLPQTCYLFSYFTGNGEDGLHFAWSRDGLKWEALKGGKSFLTPVVGKSKLMRDPCIVRGPDGTFHMVWTDSWWSDTIGYASSTNLIHWSEQKAIPVMADTPGVKNCWAPEIIYDDKRACFVIFWASTVPGRFPETIFEDKNDNNHRIYATTTKDFETFTPAGLFFDPGFNAIDSTLLSKDRRIYMFFKDETKYPKPMKNLRLAVATDWAGPYAVKPEPITVPGLWLEGPTALQIGDYTYLYADAYRNKHYTVLRSRELEKWEDLTGQLSMPKGIRHGTAFAVSRDVLIPLLEEK
ncbi:MAG TPA: glycoside hydrolase family 43 protein [Verrucomicrobiota bacterium]|nr:glycoside hydrolase family 43 protein [Verrucomicrobiota bacterium]